ncbi:MAG: RtcB family protein [Candidatus Pacearchaeota archaeon]
MFEKKYLKKISEYVWEIEKNYRKDMRVPARVFASEKILNEILKDESLNQLINVSTLPGIEKYALAMPDIHEGYGFPVGGVAALNIENGVISPGGIGFDINCGVRLLRSEKTFNEIKDKIENLTKMIYKEVPSGVGRGGRFILNDKDLNEVLNLGVKKIEKMGYVFKEDILNCESGGYLKEADSEFVFKQAKDRGRDQLGTIGAGNHFVEIQRIDQIFDGVVAENLGLFENQICIMIHCGSRGLGHQVATDYIRIMLNKLDDYNFNLIDKQLACAPFNSKEGQEYFKAMCAAANFAWANRQLITYEVRKAWQNVFGKKSFEELKLVYDVSHNILKIEEYDNKKMLVHRKGATRAFLNQPVLIPGSMGTASYVLLGDKNSLEISFGSTCHGAGRIMSRTKAKKMIRGSKLKTDLENKGITIMSGSLSGLAEEAPMAYKDIEEVVKVIEKLKIAKRIARLKPVGVIKG